MDKLIENEAIHDARDIMLLEESEAPDKAIKSSIKEFEEKYHKDWHEFLTALERY